MIVVDFAICLSCLLPYPPILFINSLLWSHLLNLLSFSFSWRGGDPANSELSFLTL